MSIKPTTPESDYRQGVHMGGERAAVDRQQGIRQTLDQLWRPTLATDDYMRGVRDGYTAAMENKPASLEDVA